MNQLATRYMICFTKHVVFSTSHHSSDALDYKTTLGDEYIRLLIFCVSIYSPQILHLLNRSLLEHEMHTHSVKYTPPTWQLSIIYLVLVILHEFNKVTHMSSCRLSTDSVQ